MRRSILLKLSLIAVLPVLVVVTFAPSTSAQLTLEWSLDLTHLQPESGISSHCVKVDGDGNVYIAYKDYGIGVIKIRPDKSIAFQTVYPAVERPYVLFVGPSGECYVLAGEEINGNYDHFRVFRFESTGAASWSYSWGNPRVSFVNTWGMDFSGNLWVATADFVYDAPCLDSTLKAVLMKGTSSGMTMVNTFRGPYMNGGAYPNTINPIVADRQGYVRLLLNEGAKCYNEECDEYPPACYVDQYGESTVNWSRLKVRTHSSGGSLSSETVLYTSSDPSVHEDRVWSISGNKDGELITIYTYRPDPEAWVWETSVQHKSWTTVLPNRPIGWGPTGDYNGDLYITTETVSEGLTVSTMYKLNGTNGAILWSHPWWEHHLGVDKENNFYTTPGKVDPDGNVLWNWPNLGHAGSISTFIGIDDQNNHYHFDGVLGQKVLYKFVEELTLTIQDALRDPLSNVEVELVKVTNDRPVFSEQPLGRVTTDNEGKIDFTASTDPDWDWEITTTGGLIKLNTRDTIKIAKHLHSAAAVKHPTTLPTMYSIHLDNAKFDAAGAVSFYELGTDESTIVLDHTELRYNLLVSIEWDARLDYWNQLDDNFRAMSNYLYDVTDGQVRLDTVMIFDDAEHWGEADMWILADNFERPRVVGTPPGIMAAGSNGGQILMPRRWFANRDAGRNLSESNHPLNLVHPNDYRTKAHEFGHYALGFYDEYWFWDPASGTFLEDEPSLRCNPRHLFNYGYMDRQYDDLGENSSELSSKYGYVLEACRNTKQYRLRGMSCWDYLENWVEATRWGPQDIFVPILKPDREDPDERSNLTGDIFPGPNDNIAALDYDIGRRVVFTHPIRSPEIGIGHIHITAYHGGSVGDKVEVKIRNNPSDPNSPPLVQGQTADNGGMWVIGALVLNCDIEAWKGLTQATIIRNSLSSQSVHGKWFSGGVTLGGSGVSRYARYPSALAPGDSLNLELVEMAGDYPLLFGLSLAESSVDLKIIAPNALPSIPTGDLETDAGIYSTFDMSSVADGFSGTVADSLGQSGTFTVRSIDDSSRAFFVPVDYVAAHRDTLSGSFAFDGAREAVNVWVDSVNTDITRGLLLSSSYPVPLDGLGSVAVQGGQAHSLSLYPNTSLTGANQITIYYADADLVLDSGLTGDETTLEVFQWDHANAQWESLGGTVNTELNIVQALIHSGGIYAAFTTQVITDVEDGGYGDHLPYGFELHQNYPNPFNPATTIQYSLPERSQVRIEVFNLLGQKVQTLVDTEMSAGSYTVSWDGTDGSGKPVATGVYLYRFQAGEHIQTKKMLLLK